jgi:hypothetical protein
MPQVLSDLLAMGSNLQRFSPKDKAQADEYERTKAALNKEAETRWDDPLWHREQAAILQSVLDYGFTFENLFSTYFLTRSVPEFEKVYLRERTGLKVFYTHRGGYIEESQIQVQDWEVPRDTLGFHFSEFEDKLRSNFADSLEALATLGQARMEAEVNRRMFNLLQEAVPNTSPYYVDATASGLTAAVLNAAIRNVMDAIKPNGLGPVPVTILGRAVAVDRITDLVTAPGTFDPEAIAEVRSRGRIGTYRGANLVRITNYTDESGVSYIPEDEVWVFGGTVGLFCTYGSGRTKSWSENSVDYVHYQHRRDIGGLVHHPEQARRIKITP